MGMGIAVVVLYGTHPYNNKSHNMVKIMLLIILSILYVMGGMGATRPLKRLRTEKEHCVTVRSSEGEEVIEVPQSLTVKSVTITQMIEDTEDYETIIPLSLSTDQIKTLFFEIQQNLNEEKNPTATGSRAAAREVIKRGDLGLPQLLNAAIFLGMNDATNEIVQVIAEMDYTPRNLFLLYNEVKEPTDVIESMLIRKIYLSYDCDKRKTLISEDDTKRANNLLEHIGFKEETTPSYKEYFYLALALIKNTMYAKTAFSWEIQLYDHEKCNFLQEASDTTNLTPVDVNTIKRDFQHFDSLQQAQIIAFAHAFPTGDLFNFLVWQLDSKQLFRASNELQNFDVFTDISIKLILKMFSENANAEPYVPNSGEPSPLKKYLEPLLIIDNFVTAIGATLKREIALSEKIIAQVQPYFTHMESTVFYQSLCDEDSISSDEIYIASTNFNELALLSGLLHLTEL